MSDRLPVFALEDLGQDLARLERLDRRGSPTFRRGRSRLRGVVLGAGVALVASTSFAVAAVTGIFDRQPDGLVRTSVPQTIAQGDDALFGHWSAVTYESDHGMCLDVTVEHNIADESMMSGSCGSEHAISQGGGGPTAPKTFFYGLVDEAATTVRVEIARKASITVPAHRVSDELGSFYFASVRRNVRSDGVRAVALNAQHQPVGPTLSAP